MLITDCSAMPTGKRPKDSVHWFFDELTSRIITETGIPSDRFHLGKIILQSLKDAPDFVSQIDGATGETESNQSVLERTVQCATAFRNFGLQPGDVIILMAPNHMDLAIPLYAALCIGVAVAAIDKGLTVKELYETFSVDKPKMIFCQSEKATDVQLALNELDLDAEIISFDKGDYLCSFPKFLEKYSDDSPIGNFKPTDFDPAETIAFLIATSGTTGLPKAAAATHKNLRMAMPYVWSRSTNLPCPTRMAMIGSPLQWLSAIINFILSPILRYTRLQSSLALDQEHAYHLVNTYKPTFTILSPTLMTTLLKTEDRGRCDFSCLEIIMLGGSAVPYDLIEEVKKIAPKTEVYNAYGMTELSGIGFHPDNTAGSCGTPMGCLQYRLIDIETLEDIMEPNVSGEMWVKGPGIFKEYYNNPTATEETFAEGRWLKTGDLFYRDENWNFFFVERIKLMLKYKSHHISPVEVENVIRQHPGIADVAVTGLPDAECGDLAVACVVRRAGYKVTAKEIKELVRESLTETKQLRGGVVFVNELPMTASTKIHRRKLKEMVLHLERE